jgi:AraC-like DNA-binding protein
VSVRQLYKLFETQECTVAEWIRHRRMERCRRDLSDPALLHRPVGAIAAQWGLPTPRTSTGSSVPFMAAHPGSSG